jgi:hypothetical protein
MSAISKVQFFQQQVSRANPHDNEKVGDKCIICWNPYDTDERPGSRLPCGLVAPSNTGDGNQCPLCRSFFFQPDSTIRERLQDLELPPLPNALVGIWNDLPRYVQIPLIFLFWVVDFLRYVRKSFVIVFRLWAMMPYRIRIGPLYALCGIYWSGVLTGHFTDHGMGPSPPFRGPYVDVWVWVVTLLLAVRTFLWFCNGK